MGALVLGFAPAAQAQTPSFFPAGASIDTTAYTMRLQGNDRYQTAAAQAVLATASEGNTGYPFNEPNKTDPTLANAGRGCPVAVGIATGDTPADALAASAAWETTLNGIPLADGSGTADVSTQDAVLLLTNSAREGATDLNPDTLRALQKIRSACEGTGDTFDAVVFGGSSAIPAEALVTLDSVANNVYEVAGTDRFDTARHIALSILGGGTAFDIQHFPTAASTGTTLTQTVFLAEGQTGADALSVGAYASQSGMIADNFGENTPVLLTNTGDLPVATRNALIAIAPQNIVVLGGTAAISDATAAAAATAAGGATVTRIAGTDRFATSVAIAEQLFDIWPDNASAGDGIFSGQPFGFARSEGAGAAHVGWPDALTSAWYLGPMTNNECEGETPIRLAPPVEKNDGTDTIGGFCEATPLLLVQQTGLPSGTSSYLSGLYPASADIVTATNPGGVDQGGFGYIFGGSAAIARSTEGSISSALSAGTYTSANQSDLAPTQANGSVFYTNLDFGAYTPGTAAGGPNGATAAGDKVCGFRNAFTGTQWLALYDADGSFADAQQTNYQPTGGGFTAFQNLFTCATPDTTKANAFGISLSGHETPAKALDWTAATARLSSDAAGADAAANTASPPSGCDVYADQAAGTSCAETWTFSGATPVTFQNVSHAGATFTLSVTVTRTDGAGSDNNDSITASGTLTVADGATLFTATLTGESSTNVSPLMISGFYTESGAVGGFHLTLTGAGATAALSDLAFQGNAA